MRRSSPSAGIALGLGALLGACSSESLGPHAGSGAGGTTGHTGGSGGSRPSAGGSGGDAGSGGDLGGSGGDLGGSGGDLGGSGGSVPGSSTCQNVGTEATGSCDPEIGPVCGCDGVTYANQCDAYENGTGARYGAACPLPIGSYCSTTTLTSCGVGEYCEVAVCGDTTGFCEAMPDLAKCTGPAEIVCGCDNGVYDSHCAAAANGTSVRDLGSCPPLPSGPCSSQADCGGETYANLVTCVPATCSSPEGTCQPVGQGCNILLVITDVYDVCGCDGQTYSDPCASRNAGVVVAHKGDCTASPDGGASL
ncbi:MAG TPA: Kazal-type serine protease inhibitor domain-containing protein [Polyangia bacterium]|nr:Kazal-type serine protease inhibitor domain-containing protein [Polyangia bacterium]